MAIQDSIKSVIDSIGDKIPELTNKALLLIEERGLVSNNLAERLISILIILAIAWLILHFSNVAKKPISWVIKLIAIALVLTIIFSTFIG